MSESVEVDLSLRHAQVAFMSYALYRPVIEQASTQPALWRLFAGLVTVLLVTVVWSMDVFFFATVVLARDLFGLFAGSPGPFETILTLIFILGLGFGAWAAGRNWHGRSLRSLIGRGPRSLRDFFWAALLTWAVAGSFWALTLVISDPLTPNLPFDEWLAWLPVALIAILLQTGSEELLFRGYLQSQLAARFGTVWVWMLVPSLMFGALHFLPGDTLAPGLVYVGLTTLFGVIAADLTARTGSIGAAWGLHFANNCIAILVVVYLGAASGLGLYSAGPVEEALALSPILLMDVLILVLIWLVIRRAVTR
ncbi:MAG: type II CAAX endopeptidase family protein [Pseudomonadota bacterium]